MITKHCPSCGMDIPFEASVCPYCRTEQDLSYDNSEEACEKRRKYAKILTIIGLIVFVLMATLIYEPLMSDSSWSGIAGFATIFISLVAAGFFFWLPAYILWEYSK